MTTLTRTADQSGERADAFLARAVEGLTRSAAQRLLEEGAVTLNGKPLKKNYKTTPGDLLEITLPDPEPVDVVPQNIPLDVVYEDSDVIVVNKPVGMVVHPAPGHPDGTLVNALLYHCGDSLSGINGELRPGIVHRIDRDTSGLIIAAKNDKAHLALAEQLQDHSLARVYEAIAVGGFREDEGTVDAPSAATPWTASAWPSTPETDETLSPTGRFSSVSPMGLPISSVNWRPDAPTKFASTWPPSTTPCWAMWSTAIRSPTPVWPDSAFTPASCAFSILPPAKRWRWNVPCPSGSRIHWTSSANRNFHIASAFCG